MVAFILRKTRKNRDSSNILSQVHVSKMASASNRIEENPIHDLISNGSSSLADAISGLEGKVEDLHIKRKVQKNLDSNLEALYLEFDELSRQFTALKKDEKLVDMILPKENVLFNKFSQTEERSIIELSDAKSSVKNCLLQLLSIDHYLEGNENEALVIRKLLTHECFDDSENIYNIQSLSVGPVYFEVKSQGIFDEQEMQTEWSSKNSSKERKPEKKSLFHWMCCSGGTGKRKEPRKKISSKRGRTFGRARTRRMTPAARAI